MKCLLLAILIAGNAFAASVTEYDKTVEEVFLQQGEAAPELSEVRDIGEARDRWLNLKRRQKFTVPSTKAVRFEFQIPEGIDFEAIGIVDELATNAWNELVACSGGPKEAREAYAKGAICADARDTFSELKNSVVVFLSSTPSKPLVYEKALKPESDHTSEHLKDGLKYMARNGFMVGTFYDYDLHNNVFGVNRIIDGVQFPSLHPLLRQLFLEAAADGYPFPFGTYDCGGAGCAVNLLLLFHAPRQLILPTPVTWEGRRYTRDHQKELNAVDAIGLLKKIFYGEELPHLKEVPLGEPFFQKLRRSFAALHLLSLASLGPQRCGDWGLWPERSIRLLSTITSTEIHLAGRVYEFDEADRILYRLKGVCSYKAPDVRVAPYVWNPLAIDLLAEAGAWRKLFNTED